MSILHGTLPARAEDRRREAAQQLAPLGELFPFEPRFLDHGGVLQHYVDEGPRDAAPLLFLHGNPTWSFAWRRALAGLRGSHRVVAPDHVGCGLSDKPAGYPYRLAQHAENVAALVDRLGLERITLVMHDWGGAIGMAFARRRPELVARLVALNTAAFRSRRIPLRIAACRVPVLGRLAVLGLNAFARAATRMAVERPLPPEVARAYLLPYDSWESRIATLAFVEDIPLAPGHPSWDELVAVEEALAGFRGLPALLLWGERDWCFTPRFREEWQRRFPEAEVVRFPDAGHWVMEDAGAEVVRELARFLAAHPLR